MINGLIRFSISQRLLVLEPYFSTKETGIGLGLALTKKLIEDHGGQIMVSSEVEVGTTFTVVLPREPIAEPQPASLPLSADLSSIFDGPPGVAQTM